MVRKLLLASSIPMLIHSSATQVGTIHSWSCRLCLCLREPAQPSASLWCACRHVLCCAQITVALFTLLFFLSAFLWGSPYRSSVPNYLQAYIQLTLFCTLYCEFTSATQWSLR